MGQPAEYPLPAHIQELLDRFVVACQTDDRVLAAFLVGSYATGTADAYSDLDLYLLTSDDAYEGFCHGRAAFIEQLGTPLFLEDFDIPHMSFIIFPNGAECELTIASEGQLNHIFNKPFRVLLDKKNLTTGATLVGIDYPSIDTQTEVLRRQINWFFHDLSHFIVAMGRQKWWWAYGQLEILRGVCVNLVRLQHNLADSDVDNESYFKLEYAVPVGELSALKTTFCPMEPSAMRQSGLTIVRFFQDIAPRLAQANGIAYPTELEHMMVKRLEELG